VGLKLRGILAEVRFLVTCSLSFGFITAQLAVSSTISGMLI